MSWLFTLMSLFSLTIVTLIIGIIATRFVGPRAIVSVFIPAVAITVFIFLVSEVLVNRIFRAEKPDPLQDQNLLATIQKIAKNRGMWIVPRVYILNVGSPNAMAYGVGLPGLAAVGISRELLDLLTPEELEGVIGHEVAHIRCRDIGLMTVISLLHSFIERCARLLSSGRSVWARSLFLSALIWVVLQIAKGIFSLLRFSISQERELAADALGATYQGSPLPLMSALRKLHASRGNVGHTKEMFDDEEIGNGNPFSDIMISHPGLKERIASLEEIFSIPTH